MDPKQALRSDFHQQDPTIVLNTQADVPWNMPWYVRHGFVVVQPDEWTQGMRAVVEAQRESGIDWSAHVHMRLVVS